MARSMSSTLATPSSSMRMASSPMATPRRDVAKPGESFTTIGCFPIFSATARIALAHSPLPNAFLQRRVDRRGRRVERRPVGIVDDGLVARQRREVGDAAPHRAGPDDRDLPDHGGRSYDENVRIPDGSPRRM